MIYTVHVPRHAYDPDEAADRARFIRDGFSWGAFFFGPLWFAWQRSWVGLVLDLAMIGALVLLHWLAGLPPVALPGLLLALAVLTGFEGPALARWSADRRRFRCVGVVSAASREEAEHQFLRRWASRPARARASLSAAGGSDMPLGLFPEEAG
jgi:hypothetical protein